MQENEVMETWETLKMIRGKINPEVKEAIDKGVLMDVAYGNARC
jgi:hypothetical protein